MVFLSIHHLPTASYVTPPNLFSTPLNPLFTSFENPKLLISGTKCIQQQQLCIGIPSIYASSMSILRFDERHQ
jgi:hypothetical protein